MMGDYHKNRILSFHCNMFIYR